MKRSVCAAAAIAILAAFTIPADAQQPPTGGQPGNVRRVPLQPEWAPISPAHQGHVDEILKYWEYKSNQIERYICKFKRWEYDPVFGPAGTFRVYAEGVVMYESPDKGLYRDEKTAVYRAPAKEGEKPGYVTSPDSPGQHWVCDGRSVFQFDPVNKQLVVQELPPEYQGKAISDGPLPFLFGASAEKIKSRYWLRMVTPKQAADSGEYWLEAWPKTQEDASAYQKIEIILDKSFLPKAMQIFAVGYDARRNPARTTYLFSDREVNKTEGGLIGQVNPFKREFFEPATPRGWKRIERPYNAPSRLAPPSASNPRSGPPRFPR